MSCIDWHIAIGLAETHGGYVRTEEYMHGTDGCQSTGLSRNGGVLAAAFVSPDGRARGVLTVVSHNLNPGEDQ